MPLVARLSLQARVYFHTRDMLTKPRRALTFRRHAYLRGSRHEHIITAGCRQEMMMFDDGQGHGCLQLLRQQIGLPVYAYRGHFAFHFHARIPAAPSAYQPPFSESWRFIILCITFLLSRRAHNISRSR